MVHADTGLYLKSVLGGAVKWTPLLSEALEFNLRKTAEYVIKQNQLNCNIEVLYV